MAGHILHVLLGLAVGALGTLVGAGGGFILMPILLFLYPGGSPDVLTAVSLAVVFANAASGTVSYAAMGRIDYRSGLLFLLAALPGAAAGAIAVGYVPRDVFCTIFGVALSAAGALVFARPESARGEEPDRLRGGRGFNVPFGMLLSFGVGFASSLLGLGGGIIHVPVMVYLLGFPVHVATATSHFVLAGVALAGTAVHLISGSLRGLFPMTGALAIGAVAGAQLGARLSSRVRGTWIMRILGLALGLVGVRILLVALWP